MYKDGYRSSASRGGTCSHTCEDAQENVEIFQAGCKGADDQTCSRHEASQNYCGSAGETAHEESTQGSWGKEKKEIKKRHPAWITLVSLTDG